MMNDFNMFLCFWVLMTDRRTDGLKSIVNLKLIVDLKSIVDLSRLLKDDIMNDILMFGGFDDRLTD